MQAQNIRKLATNKMPSYQKWGFPLPIFTYSRKHACVIAEPLCMACEQSS